MNIYYKESQSLAQLDRANKRKETIGNVALGVLAFCLLLSLSSPVFFQYLFSVF